MYITSLLRLSRCLKLLVVIRPDVLRPDDQLVDPEVHGVEGEPRVGPELAEVHVEREVHVLQNQRSMSKVKILIRIKIKKIDHQTFSERSPMERMYKVTPTVTGIPP